MEPIIPKEKFWKEQGLIVCYIIIYASGMRFVYFIYYLGLVLISSPLPSINKKDILFSYFKLYLKYVIFVLIFKKNILSETILGFRLSFLDYSTFIFLFEEIFIMNVYYFEAETDNPFICDCGANVGISVLYFKKLYPNCKLLAFEPDRRAFRLLKANVRVNHFKNVRLINSAIYKKKGFVKFYYDKAHPDSLSMSIKKGRGNSISFRKIPAVLLSSYLKERVDFLKMDIEGVEGSVINELFQTKKLSFVREAVVEFHHHIEPKEDLLSQTLKIFEDSHFGYQIYTHIRMPFSRGKFQGILIYAYKK